MTAKRPGDAADGHGRDNQRPAIRRVTEAMRARRRQHGADVRLVPFRHAAMATPRSRYEYIVRYRSDGSLRQAGTSASTAETDTDDYSPRRLG